MYAISCLSIIGFFSIMPYISRKNISFGISIPEQAWYSPEVETIRKNYLVKGLILSAVILVVAVVSSIIIKLPEGEYLFSIPAMLLILTGYGGLYLSAYKKMKALKAESEWKNQSREVIVVDTSFRRGKYTISAMWLLLYPAIIAFTILLGVALYDQAPNQIPMNFDFSGHVYHYVEKTPRIIYMAPTVQFFLAFIFTFAYWMIIKSKQQIDSANPEKSAEQNRKFRYRWSAFMVFSGVGMQLMFMLMHLSNLGVIRDLRVIAMTPLIFCFLMIAALILVSVTTGQSGNRIHVFQDKNGNKVSITREDDKYWKLGSLYYNPEDPSIFIEKRFGIGWTMNWGRPVSWIIMIGLLILILGMMIFSMLFSD
ncbi:MAG: DUF1648 domain-containing protein [Thermoclostridium sp.]|nr:DUF1648 domain-containing protein [Thermoclostridium sp.]